MSTLNEAAPEFILELRLLMAAANIAAIRSPETPVGSSVTIYQGKIASFEINSECKASD